MVIRFLNKKLKKRPCQHYVYRKVKTSIYSTPCFLIRKEKFKKNGKVKPENNEIDHLGQGDTKGGKDEGERTHL